MTKIMVCFLLLLTNSILANQDSEGDLSPLADIDCEPSSIINRAVNVITGAFCDTQTDLIIPGPRPLTLERSYTSNNDKIGTLFYFWNFNHTNYLNGTLGNLEDPTSCPTLVDAFGSTHHLNGRVGRHDNKLYPHKIQTYHYYKGMTNSASGQISAKTNIKNDTLFYRKKDNYCFYQSANGDTTIYKEFTSVPLLNIYYWRPKTKKFLNGDQLFYKHSKLNHILQPMPKKIEYANSLGEIISHLQWEYYKSDKFKKRPKVEVTSSDGRMVTYYFDSWEDKHDKYHYFLRRVIRPNAPEETYFYEKKTNRITRKERPDSRFLKISYYEKGHNYIGDVDIKINSKSDIKMHRVKFLEAPTGTDNSPIITHKFIYNLRSRKVGESKVASGGSTEVLDALNHKTIYRFSDEYRLTDIEKYRDSGELFATEKLFWGDNTSPNATNLISRAFYTGDGNIYFCKNYEYDAFGNVIKDHLYGNLSGWNSKSIDILKFGEVINHDCEIYTKNFCYNSDNQMIKEQDHRKTIHFDYLSNTDLLERKLTLSSQRIEKRSFYCYDNNGCLITEIIDNGSNPNKDDLTNVTQRLIKKITPENNVPKGFPKIIEEFYLDLATNRECLLKKTINIFSPIGKLIQRDSYDANNEYVYSEYWDYDSIGNQILAVDALGQTTVRQYDSHGNIIYEQGPRKDFHKEFVYDYSNRLIREEIVLEDGLRLATCHKYDLTGNRIATVDIYGNETRFEYDEFHRPIKTYPPMILDENGALKIPEITTEYDVMSHPTLVKDARGCVTKTLYNIHGKPALILNPDGTQQKNIYSTDGTLTESISPTGLVTRYEYDYQERVTKKELYSPEGILLETESFAYDAFHLLCETDAKGIKTHYEYDGAGRLIEKTCESFCMRYYYDRLGRVSEEHNIYDGTSCTVKSIEYDLLNRIIEERIEESNGTVRRKIGYKYDDQGNRTEVIHYGEAGPSITTTKYDFQRKPIEIIDAIGSVTTIFYDYQYTNEMGQMVPYEEIIDPYGGITVTIFDAHGRKVNTLRKTPVGIIIQDRKYFYDLSGNLAKQVDKILSPNQEDRYAIVTWKYDNANRKIECIEALGTPEQKTTKTLYNSNGQKETIIKPDGIRILHTYDIMGRLQTYQSSDNSIHYIYSYDARSNPISVLDKIHNTLSTQEFDEENRLIRETLGNGLSINYCYDSQGRPIAIKLPDNTSIEYTYNAIDIEKVHRIGKNQDYTFNYHQYDLRGNLLKSDGLSLEYDLMGRITGISSDTWESHDITYDKMSNIIYRNVKDISGNTSLYYTYDALQQLMKEEGDINHVYEYDSLYNRLKKDDKTYNFNTLNQLVDPFWMYNANGCLIKKDDETYEYDALNRLTSVTKGFTKYKYLYDERNRRISKHICELSGNAWNLSKTIHYLYTGANEIGSIEDGMITELRILGIGKGAELGAAVAMEFNGNIYYPTHDHNGNVVMLSDLEGNPIENYRYTAFGEEKIVNGYGCELSESINPWRFSSKRVDEETGFIYFGRRYYDPDYGRWITPDPAGFSEGPNLYAYVSNNPLTHVDLYGLMLAGNHGFFCQAVQYLGAALQLLGDHFLPIPIVRELVSFTGHLMENRTVTNFRPSSAEPHSGNYSTWDPEGPFKEQVMMVQGMLTNFSEACIRAENMAKEYGGIAIHYTFNATHGFISDLMECVAQQLGLPTRSVDKCVEHIKERISAAGGVDSGNRVTIHAHSQGGLILYRALQHLTAEEKKMLHVKTYGSAKMISSKGLGSAVNYINSRDYVPYISDLIGVIKGAFSSNYDIRRLPSSPYSIFDHNFDKGNYWEEIITQGSDYQIRNGLVKS